MPTPAWSELEDRVRKEYCDIRRRLDAEPTPTAAEKLADNIVSAQAAEVRALREALEEIAKPGSFMPRRLARTALDQAKED